LRIPSRLLFFILLARIFFSFLISLSLFLSLSLSLSLSLPTLTFRFNRNNITVIPPPSSPVISLFAVVRSLKTAYSATARHRYGSRGKIETRRKRGEEKGGGSHSARFSPHHVTDWYTSRAIIAMWDYERVSCTISLWLNYMKRHVLSHVIRIRPKWPTRPNRKEVKNDVSRSHILTLTRARELLYY